jgi:hypothetical protein
MNNASKPQEMSNLRDLLRVAFDRSPNGHFCQLTSAYYHGLSDQVPSRVYIRKLNVGTGKRKRPERLGDLQIRSQFLKPHRRTDNVISFGQGEVVLIAGSRFDQVGVTPIPKARRDFPEGARITNLERCLIDAVVAPHYNGGVSSLPGLFVQAAEALDPDTLVDHYGELDFLYPFHQAWGFFLDHGGLTDAA